MMAFSRYTPGYLPTALFKQAFLFRDGKGPSPGPSLSSFSFLSLCLNVPSFLENLPKVSIPDIFQIYFFLFVFGRAGSSLLPAGVL